MSKTSPFLITPPHRLRERVCLAEDGFSIEELLSRSEAIVERTISQWRGTAAFELEDWSRRMHQPGSQVRSAHSTLPLLRLFIEDIAQHAEAFGLGEARKAAVELLAQLTALEVLGAAYPDGVIPTLESSMARLCERLRRGDRIESASGDLLAAD